jgi:hypothetical protein
LHKSCAEWIFLNVKPFVVQRFTRAQQPIEITRCYFQEGFSSGRILRFNAAEKFPSFGLPLFRGRNNDVKMIGHKNSRHDLPVSQLFDAARLNAWSACLL